MSIKKLAIPISFEPLYNTHTVNALKIILVRNKAMIKDKQVSKLIRNNEITQQLLVKVKFYGHCDDN